MSKERLPKRSENIFNERPQDPAQVLLLCSNSQARPAPAKPINQAQAAALQWFWMGAGAKVRPRRSGTDSRAEHSISPAIQCKLGAARVCVHLFVRLRRHLSPPSAA